ncbi:pentapeptide repeat-containing protein [Sphingobium yanoikuyae]|uniref:pentapeptide repeat-containing protein n=1 Tax=Sphingobium yanoikuyae TaxID=13690 RepID=UPI002FD9C05D
MVGEVAYDAEAVELRFIEQEHRLFHSIANVIKFRKGPENKRRASILALGWAITSRSTRAAAAGGVGLIALLSLVAALRANELIVGQSRRMDQQTLLIDAQRRASLNVEMSSIWDQIRAEYRGDLPEGTLREASPLLTARLVYISRAFQPYVVVRTRTLSAEQNTSSRVSWTDSLWPKTGELLPLTQTPLSPERGQLLVALNLTGFDLTAISHRGATFANADLENQNLTFTRLQGVDLYRASFRNSAIFWSSFTGANLVETNFDCVEFDSVAFGFGGGTVFVDHPTFRNAVLGNFVVDSNDDEFDYIHPAVFEWFDLTDAFLDGLRIKPEYIEDIPKNFDRDRYKLVLSEGFYFVQARNPEEENRRKEAASQTCDVKQRAPIDPRVGRNFSSVSRRE